MTGRPPYPEWDPEPRAVVQRKGRHSYVVFISHGIIRYGPDGYGWVIYGRNRALRKAAKVLADYLRREHDITTVTA